MDQGIRNEMLYQEVEGPSVQWGRIAPRGTSGGMRHSNVRTEAV